MIKEEDMTMLCSLIAMNICTQNALRQMNKDAEEAEKMKETKETKEDVERKDDNKKSLIQMFLGLFK